MAKQQTYREKTDAHYDEKAEQIKKNLPLFLDKYYDYINEFTASSKYEYISDLYFFFDWIRSDPKYAGYSLKELPFEAFKELTYDDLMSYLTEYGPNKENKASSRSRKLASIKSVYKYFSTKKAIDNNPASLISIKVPVKSEDEKVFLQPNEIANLLDCIDKGSGMEKLGGRKEAWRKINRTRDLAILTILLGTGMRVSELVGLNTTDVDFENGALHIIRKGRKKGIVYMGDEVTTALTDYINNGRAYYQPAEDEKALFLSLKHKRLAVRSIEDLLKKYVEAAIPYRSDEKISPHKMRSTFATSLYNDTGDIKLVADAIGHTNISTTQRYYAATNQEIKRSAFTRVQLR